MTLSASPTRGVITATDLLTDADVLPPLPGLDFIVEKAPEYSTTVRRSASGREIRAAWYSSPIWNFKIRFNVLRNIVATPELARLVGFFNSRLGKFGCFYYLDPEDNQVTDQAIAVGNGTTRSFQTIRTVGANPHQMNEPVYAFWKNPVVKVNGTVTAVTVSPWGVITFASAPAAGALISWTGQYMYVCRFDVDRLTLEQIVSALWSQNGLPFVSLKP